MKTSLRFCLLGCLAIMAGFAGITPARASVPWSPGFYAGWISFSARIDTDAQWPAMKAFVIEKYAGRGQLMVRVDDQGMGGASVVLPVDIQILDYGNMQMPNGDCIFSSYAIAHTNYVHLRSGSVEISDEFELPINLTPGMRFKSTHSASFGNLQGCDKAGPGNLRAMKKAMQMTTAEMRQLHFSVLYSTGSSVGGTCSIVGWNKTTPVSNGTGQGVRSLPSCTWRIFRSGADNPGSEWQQ